MVVEGLREALSGRYTIERELGRGGMATVYLAMDVKVGRRVAIKVLLPELAAALGGERFHREIQIASHLTHPNILPVYDSGEADGTLYYVMPFVEGESLRDRLDRERQLGIDESIRITCQVASALDHAHAANIVHRDIKPENILIEAGQAVVADFGIARAVTSAADAETLTRTGMSLGTPAYMSPEQAMGERNLDGRSDQYALACVTYEMLAGQPPFTASTMQALVARHIAEQVPLITTVRQAVPDEVQDVILQALEKVPADRFPTIGQFAEALAEAGSLTMTATSRRVVTPRSMRYTTRTNRVSRRRTDSWSRRRQLLTAAAGALLLVGGAAAVWRWGRPTTTAASAGEIAGALDPRKIAVLYFEDQSREQDLAPLAAGLTETLIDRLDQVRTLSAISSNGVRQFRGPDVNADSVAGMLKVGTIVRGSVDEEGSRVRVQVRLVDGNSGTVINRASFTGPRGDLVVLQDSLAAQVATFLQKRLGEEVRLRERRASTRSTDAWLLVQRAEKLRRDADELALSGNTANATAVLMRADSVLAGAEAADAAWLEPIVTRGLVALRHAQLEKELNAVPWIDAALGHAARALQRAPNNPAALALRGTARYQRWRLRLTPDHKALDSLLVSARRDLESAVAADPSLARANITLSYLYYETEDVPGALLAARHAYEQDAYLKDADYTLVRLFWGSLDLEQFGEARRWCAEGAQRFQRDYRFIQCQLWLMATPAVPADPERAWRLLATLDSLTPAAQRGFAVTQGRLLVGGVLGRAGLADSGRRVLQSTRQRITHEIDPNQDLLSHEAYVRTLVGDPDTAIDLLKRFVAANPGHEFLQQAGTVWWWRDLKTHPRWRELGHAGR